MIGRKEALVHVVVWVVAFLALSVLWELSVIKFLVWSWKQLLLERPLFSVKEALITFIGTALMYLIVIPHALWVPVIFMKEIRDYVRIQRKLQLARYESGYYVARPRH